MNDTDFAASYFRDYGLTRSLIKVNLTERRGDLLQWNCALCGLNYLHFIFVICPAGALFEHWTTASPYSARWRVNSRNSLKVRPTREIIQSPPVRVVLPQIQGPILSKDLNTMSDQLDNISRQLQDRSVVRELQSIGITMRDLEVRLVKPLMKLQDDLVYRLAVLELQVQPLWRQANQSISHLRTIQYYIDHRGEKIAQLVGGVTQSRRIIRRKTRYIIVDVVVNGYVRAR